MEDYYTPKMKSVVHVEEVIQLSCLKKCRQSALLKNKGGPL